MSQINPRALRRIPPEVRGRIEIGDEAVGVIARETEGYRFYAAKASYRILEGRVFGSAEEAHKAALRSHRRSATIPSAVTSLLQIPLDLSQPPVTFAAQAHAVVKKTPFVPFHGATMGFIVNYSPDHAVRFDLDGDPVESFECAYIPGEVELFLRGRKVPTGAFAKGAIAESR